MGPSFAYASYISDDPDRSAQVLGRLGVPVIWEGMHPFFGVPAIVCGTRDGSIMVLGPPDLESAHPAVARYRSARERMFHLAVRAGDGLSPAELFRSGESWRYTAPTRARAARQWLSACQWGTARGSGSRFAWRPARSRPPGPPSRGWRAYLWWGPRLPCCARASPGWV